MSMTLGELGEKIRQFLGLSFVPKFLRYPISRKISPVYVVNPHTKLKDPARIDQAITQNQWYDVWTGSACSAGAGSKKCNVKVYGITFLQATAQEDLEVRIIADDVDETIAQTAAAGTAYFIGRSNSVADGNHFRSSTSALLDYGSGEFECRSLQVMFRKTTAAGANDSAIKVLYGEC